MSASRIPGLTEREFPLNGTPREKLAFAIKFAGMAPTPGDWQPWEFRLADTHVELISKEDPALEANDPYGREAVIGCGAALLFLKLALKHFGCLGRVALFPDLGQPELAARIHFGFCGGRDTEEKLLFEAMTADPTNTSRLGGTPLSETMLTCLSLAAAGERGWLDFVRSETVRQRVMDLAQHADSLSTNSEASTHRPTIPGATGGTLRWLPPLFTAGGRDSGARKPADAPVRQSSVLNATVAIVKTKTDEKYGWLTAGQTVARTVLQAQALGLSWDFVNPVRRREAREALRVQVGHKGFAQVILRFGPLTASETILLAVPKAPTATYRSGAS